MRSNRVRALVTLASALAVALSLGAQPSRALSDSAFAHLVATLSEPSGYFDTDNLISNEDSYLHPVGTLARLGIHGGAYLGVGPDQNFSYIAAARPSVAFILDIRRDNLLEHVLFKSLFALAHDRIEYLCLLFGEPPPVDTVGWGTRDVEALLHYIDSVRADPAAGRRVRPALIARVLERAENGAIPLSSADKATIARFHLTFMANGPGLRFNSFNRAPQPYYPDYRRLLLERDRGGRKANYLATEASFGFVKSLEDNNLVVPVVGDFSGGKALPAIARWLRAHQDTVSVFYTSNVEQYLFQNGTFDQYARNVVQLPRNENSVMIRSYFSGGHPQAVAGYHAVMTVQRMTRFAAIASAGGFSNFYDLSTKEVLQP